MGLWTSPPAQAQDGLAGHWEGQIEIPDQPLTVLVDLVHGDDGWTGTIDIPAQGAKALPLDRIAVDEASATFAIQGSARRAHLFGSLGDRALCAAGLRKRGATFPFALGRGATPTATVARRRPRPPFPYASEEVRFEADPVSLAGTLTIPEGEPPFPAVLLISGSGQQNRDQELFGHKPFQVLADYLSRAGIAVLRVDDAGAGESTPHPQPPTTLDFVADAAAAVDFLKADARIRSIGLIGHSEGGAIAPILASRRNDIAFLVLLAAPGVPGAELMRRQNERIFAAAGIVGEQRDVLMGLIDQLFDILTAEDASDTAAVDPLVAIVGAQLFERHADHDVGAVRVIEEEVAHAVPADSAQSQ